MIRKFLSSFLSLSVFGLIAAAIGAEPPAPIPDGRYVFAHYMTCFSASPEYYRREIQLAQHYRIDGFALNCGEWMIPGKEGKAPTLTRYVVNANNIYEQAKQLDSGFRLFLSPDFVGTDIAGHALMNVCDMLTRYYEHPNQFRYRGKAFLSGYAGYTANYAPPAEKLRKDGYDFWLVPMASLPRHPMAWSVESVQKFFTPGSPFDGIFNFACDGTVSEIMNRNANARRVTNTNGKIQMAGVCPAYNSPNLRDFRGMSGYCAQWESLINDGSDLVEIVTWNDYNEDSNLNPFFWTSNAQHLPGMKNHSDRDESALDVTSFYAQWFKSGKQPIITQDRMYITYRNRSQNLVKVWDTKKKAWTDVRFGDFPYDQIHDDVQDKIYVTTFLTAAAELKIRSGEREERFMQPAGVAHAELPFQPGTPCFTLTRNGNEIANIYGRKQILAQESEQDSIKGTHFAHRTWTSGLAVGEPAITLAAKSGKMVKTELDGETVKLGATPGSSLTFTLPERADKQPVTFNFRVTYSNTQPSEARLTMYSDGAPGAQGAQKFYLPLFLPATGGELHTISFLWTLWPETRELYIISDHSDLPGAETLHFNDAGIASIKTIELIRVQPFTPAAAKSDPAQMLVKIPGGTFTMGSDKTSRDESPARQVTVSSFAIGKYEVTNAEFEEFQPIHKQMRDEYSWRDREPAIYVSWLEAAKYCNWLSARAGLAPYYNEKDWSVNPQTEGFRLPSEAEWEYVASGRGENRIYPWGNQEPTGKLGNFQLQSALAINPARTASLASGVQVVGSFPAGASRDGVMDLAGNVAEWCGDKFNDYAPGNQQDPLDLRTSPHRVIRGGSWGYYNSSQRVQDREFNNAGYGGYIYIGFRVAISEAGYNKLIQNVSH